METLPPQQLIEYKQTVHINKTIPLTKGQQYIISFNKQISLLKQITKQLNNELGLLKEDFEDHKNNSDDKFDDVDSSIEDIIDRIDEIKTSLQLQQSSYSMHADTVLQMQDDIMHIKEQLFVLKTQQESLKTHLCLMQHQKSSDDELKVVAHEKFINLEKDVVGLIAKTKELEFQQSTVFDIISGVQDSISELKKEFSTFKQQQNKPIGISEDKISIDVEKEKNKFDEYNKIEKNIKNNIENFKGRNYIKTVIDEHQKQINRLYFLNIFGLGTSLGLFLYIWYYVQK